MERGRKGGRDVKTREGDLVDLVRERVTVKVVTDFGVSSNLQQTFFVTTQHNLSRDSVGIDRLT